MPDSLDVLRETVAGARDIFERLLQHSGIQSTKGACAYGCFLLEMSLTRFAGATCFYRGGDGMSDGYCLDTKGRKQGHYWVEATIDAGVYVIDISGDQFGLPPVQIIPIDQASGYVAGDQETVEETMRDLLSDIIDESDLSTNPSI